MDVRAAGGDAGLSLYDRDGSPWEGVNKRAAGAGCACGDCAGG